MKNVIIERFNSLSQLIDELSKRENNHIMRNEHSSQNKGDGNWAGTNSYKEAVNYVLNGYEKPLASIKRGLIKANSKTTAPRRSKVVNDIIGYMPNVPAAIMGIPQNMIRSDIDMKKSKIIDLIYQTTVNCGTSSETVEKAGIAVLSLINDLEKNGYRVALSISFYLADTYDDEAVIATVKVKDWRQPIDLKKIAFPICNSGMLRRIGFKWLETCKGMKSSAWTSGYGRQLKYKEALKLLKEHSMISDTQFFVSIPFCEDCNFNVDKIAEKCGMKLR